MLATTIKNHKVASAIVGVVIVAITVAAVIIGVQIAKANSHNANCQNSYNTYINAYNEAIKDAQDGAIPGRAICLNVTKRVNELKNEINNNKDALILSNGDAHYYDELNSMVDGKLIL